MPRGRKSTKSSKTSQPKATKTLRTLKIPSETLKQPKKTSKSLPNTFVQTYAELDEALRAHTPKITLLDNIITVDNLLINSDVTIDFNDFSIISEESHSSARVFDLRSGHLTLTGRGKIFAMGKQSVAIRAFGSISSSTPDYTVLDIDKDISLFAPDSYGIMISPNLGVAYGLTINFYGRIFARDGIGLSGSIRPKDGNLPTINIKPGAVIVADETAGVALDAIGHGVWNIESANLSGAAGANLGSGLVNFKRSQVIARDITFNLCASEAQTLKATADGGTYLAERNANVAGTPSPSAKITLKSGKFYAPEPNIAKGVESSAKILTRAVFSHDVAEVLSQISSPIEEVTSAELEAPAPVLASAEPLPSAMPTAENPPANYFVEPQPVETTDEELIIAELNSEESEHPLPAPASPSLPPAPSPTQVMNDQTAARMALADAINDIRNLNARDYGTGFSDLEQVIKYAESVLSNPQTSISDIFGAASQLLQAFDGLKQETDDNPLSDAELDELFYHGAVLEEMVSDSTFDLPDLQPVVPEPIFEQSVAIQTSFEQPDFSELDFEEPDLAPLSPAEASSLNNMANQLSLQAQDYDTSEPLATDFGQISALLNLIADLDLSRYLASTQNDLLKALAEAEETLNDPSCSQDDIDDVAELLTDGLRELELVRNAHVATRTPKSLPKTSTPAPVAKQTVLATMVDEMSPAPTWTSGVTMIDEMTPFTTDPDTFEKMLRSTRPVLLALLEAGLHPLKKLSRSLVAGTRAGLKAYRDAFHAFKN